MSQTQDEEFEAYTRAISSLHALIGGERFASRSTVARRQRAEAKLARIRATLEVLGNPQHHYPTIHVTGTSGKGSTAAYVSGVLTAAGYRAGLRTSPYLQVATEKLQIGSSLIDARSFDELVSMVLHDAFRIDHQGERVSYAEAWAVLSYWWLAERQVDVAVIEVGAGGRFDATNVIDPIVSVITTVGLDHVISLGPNIEDIAWHKAGIIKPGSTTVVGDIPNAALAVIAEESRARGARLVEAGASPDSTYPIPPLSPAFQRRNANVANAVVQVLRQNGFQIPDAALAEGINSARLPGRLERMPGELDPAVWIDGAHNGDKVSALAWEVVQIWSGRVLPVVALGILDAKDPVSIVSAIRQAASSLVVTEPHVVGKRPLAADRLAACARNVGFDGEIYVEQDPTKAVRRAQAVAKAVGTDVLVTGSIYLSGQARRRWYRDEEIVIQRTPWPRKV